MGKRKEVEENRSRHHCRDYATLELYDQVRFKMLKIQGLLIRSEMATIISATLPITWKIKEISDGRVLDEYELVIEV